MTKATLHKIMESINNITIDETYLEVVVDVVDGFDNEEPSTLAYVIPDMYEKTLVMRVFGDAIERWNPNIISVLKHECVHVAQKQLLYSVGGWKLVFAVIAYEAAKWPYEKRPSELDAHNGGYMSPNKYLSYFKTPEFRRFYKMINTWGPEGVTLSGHFVFDK